ncbi:MAG: DUF2934 domain-containing protein [Rhodocyclaceae bacterium]|nr:MAG: DUF2934 domain-containing protein [Rhodocyclaceae bacterium]
MATTKSSAKAAPTRRPARAKAVTAAKVKPAAKAKETPKAKPEPTARTRATPRTKPAPKVKAAPKAAAAKPARSRVKKPAGIPLEQRRHYVEMAAYYIAERRGFAPGNLLDDWVQAEAEIDRLLAEGLLGG